MTEQWQQHGEDWRRAGRPVGAFTRTRKETVKEEKLVKMNYHIAEQSKLTSIHLFGFMLNDFTC